MITLVQLVFASVPIGTVSASAMQRMCRSESIIIGTVLSTKSFPKNTTNQGEVVSVRTHTEIRMSVERDLRGSNPPTLDLTVEGGRLHGVFSVTPETQPQPTVGARFMVGFVRLKKDTIPWPEGQPIFNATFQVDSTVDLPSAASIANELQASCVDL